MSSNNWLFCCVLAHSDQKLSDRFSPVIEVAAIFRPFKRATAGNDAAVVKVVANARVPRTFSQRAEDAADLRARSILISPPMVEARDVTIATRDHEHSEEMRKALRRIADLETLVYQWNLVRDVQEKRAVRHEAREVRTETRDAAADTRQSDRADRSEAREIARDAHDGIGG